MKIMIIGSGASGKSTFSRVLGPALALPVHHLDAYYWKPGWVATPAPEWDAFLQELVAGPEWIIEGNYNRTLDIRMQAAEVILLFDLSPWLTTYRLLKRMIQYRNRSRPDLAEGCPERFDWNFVRWVWTFRKKGRGRILEKLEQHGSGKTVYIFRTRREVADFLERVKREGRAGVKNP